MMGKVAKNKGKTRGKKDTHRLDRGGQRLHLDARVEWSTSCLHQGFSYFYRMVFFLSSLAFFFSFFITRCPFSPPDISMSKDFYP